MSDFYHEVLAFIEKQERLVKKGNPKAIKKILFRCAEFAPYEVFDSEAKQSEICTMLMNHKSVLQDAVLFSTKKCRAFNLYVDDLRLPFQRSVFLFDGYWGIPDDPEFVSEVMAVCSKDQESQPINVSIFLRHRSSDEGKHKTYTWTMLPYGIGLTPSLLANMSLLYNEDFDRLKQQGFDKLKIGSKVTSSFEGQTICYAIYQLVATLNRLNQEHYTIQTAQPPKSLYSSRAPGHKKFYEHRMVIIDPEKTTHREGDNSGLSGRKHALHAVRGFYRHLKKPKADGTTKIWIKPHWRGDKELGVVTKEYEIRKSA